MILRIEFQQIINLFLMPGIVEKHFMKLTIL